MQPIVESYELSQLLPHLQIPMHWEYRPVASRRRPSTRERGPKIICCAIVVTAHVRGTPSNEMQHGLQCWRQCATDRSFLRLAGDFEGQAFISGSVAERMTLLIAAVDWNLGKENVLCSRVSENGLAEALHYLRTLRSGSQTTWERQVVRATPGVQSKSNAARENMREREVRQQYMDGIRKCPSRTRSFDSRYVDATVCVDRALAKLLILFPTLSLKLAAAYLVPLSKLQPLEEALHVIIDKFLEHGVPQPEAWGIDSTFNVALPDLRGPILNVVSALGDQLDMYNRWCMYRLCVDFPRLSVALLRRALRMHNGRLTATYKAVCFESQRALHEESSRDLPVAGLFVKVQGSNAKWLLPGGLNLLRFSRTRTSLLPPECECPVFEMEWASLVMDVARDAKLFHPAKAPGNNGVSERPAQAPPKHLEELIESNCATENMCADGHVCSFSWLHGYMEESMLEGSQPTGVRVGNVNGRAACVPSSEVKTALPSSRVGNSERRNANVQSRVQLGSLVSCPFCNVPCEGDPAPGNLQCSNSSNPKILDTVLRPNGEKKIKQSAMRKCPSCKSQVSKSGGCNKISCRCGQSVCYVCLAILPAASKYDHFCHHKVWPSQKECKWCDLCALWDNEKDQG